LKVATQSYGKIDLAQRPPVPIMQNAAITTEVAMPFWNGMWWGPGSWFPMFPFGFMIFCMLIMATVVMYMMGMGPFRGKSRASALDILNERLASGNIDQAEYDKRRRVIAN
jgi:uncharacterized membrane protein